MSKDHIERDFVKNLIEEASRAGVHATYLVDILNRAYVVRDTGTWTNPSAFVQQLQQEVPAFFGGRAAPQPASPTTSPVTPTAGPVTRHSPPGVLLLSREDAKNAQTYRAAKAVAEKSGKRLEIEAS